MDLGGVLHSIPGGIEDKTVLIEYRMKVKINKKDYDIFSGTAKYENKELISCDGDTYSLYDPVVDWDVTFANDQMVRLTVYEHVEQGK